MRLEYYYSKWGQVLFLLLGLLFLFVGLDFLVFHNFITLEKEPENFVKFIILGLGFLLTSGYSWEIIKGKNVVVLVNEDGVKVVLSKGDEVLLPWMNFVRAEMVFVRPIFRPEQVNRTVKALAIVVKKDSVNWPSAVISRNRVAMEKEEEFDKVIIEGWLNKSKEKIAEEINDFKSRLG